MSEFSGKKCVVTGGAGFIGSNIVHRLVGLGASVAVVDGKISKTGFNDFIFNIAGKSMHLDSMKEPLQDLEINAKGHIALLEACRKTGFDGKIVYAGSRGQYGRAESLPVSESHPMHPPDFYGIHKLLGEEYHRLYSEVYGLKTCSLRVVNTFGPRQIMNRDHPIFLALFIRLAMDGETINVFGDGQQMRDFNYVDDVVEAFLLAAEKIKKWSAFNLGTENGVTIKEFAEEAVKAAGQGKVELVPFPDESRRIDIGSYCSDITLIRESLGWKPKTPLEEGLRKTVEFFEKNKEHYW